MQSNLLSVWGTIGSIVLAILILLAMITIHEFGHYVAGKILGFKIDEFSIGFGPALFKIKRKKSEELFAVRLIPLGGYCAFHGEDGLEEEEAKQEHSPEPFEEIVALPTEEEKPAENSAKVADGVKKPDSNTGNFTAQKPWKRIIVLVAGAFMNYLLALLLIIVSFSAYGQSVVKITGVAEPTEEYTAAYSFQEGDILLGGAGRSFYLTNDIARAINNKTAGTIVTFRVARLNEGRYEIVEQPIMLRGDVAVKNSADFRGVWGALGVGIEEREEGKFYMVESASYRFGAFETLGRSFVYSFRQAGAIFRVLGELLTGRLGLDAIGGPVTTITMTSQIASQGFHDFLEIAALIGVNLAVFNLLPIPALDGSKVVFTAIEWIRGKPISRKIEAIIHAVGFALLIGFAILVDILRFV